VLDLAALFGALPVTTLPEEFGTEWTRIEMITARCSRGGSLGATALFRTQPTRGFTRSIRNGHRRIDDFASSVDQNHGNVRRLNEGRLIVADFPRRDRVPKSYRTSTAPCRAGNVGNPKFHLASNRVPAELGSKRVNPEFRGTKFDLAWRAVRSRAADARAAPF